MRSILPIDLSGFTDEELIKWNRLESLLDEKFIVFPNEAISSSQKPELIADYNVVSRQDK